jgi:hypothetical protein
VQDPFDAVSYHVKAIFAYVAARSDDLTLNVGDLVNVIKESGDWLYGTNSNGISGWFPKAFTQTENISETKSILIAF